MSQPLIIVGAGASYDYSEKTIHGGELSPVTNQLVDNRHIDLRLLSKYPGVNNIFSRISGVVSSNSKSFEQALTDLWNEGGANESVKKDFVSLEFYLQELFKNISTNESSEYFQRMHYVNNYRALISYINMSPNKKACIISFNYDTLLERNMPESFRLKTMNDYIAGNIKIIKPHGSHDWGYVQSKAYISEGKDKSAFEIFYESPHLLDEFKKDGRTPEHALSIIEAHDYISFPAIAIPLSGKNDFICPADHLVSLRKQLPDVDRILVIGWKASDNNLLELIKEYFVSKPLRILVVAGSAEGALNVIQELKKYLTDTQIIMEPYHGGFSDFIREDISKKFFNS